MNWILASASPRRREICERMGVAVESLPAAGDPPLDRSLPLEEAVRLVARAKAEEIAARCPERRVLGADTVVEIDGQVLGKPRDKREAADMLRRLSGRAHRVLTGVWAAGPGCGCGFTSAAQVEFEPMTDEEIAAYVATGEPMDKAGAYGIQGLGMRFVHGIVGDYYTVMGLPGAALWRFLQQFPEIG